MYHVMFRLARNPVASRLAAPRWREASLILSHIRGYISIHLRLFALIINETLSERHNLRDRTRSVAIALAFKVSYENHEE